MKKNIRYKFVGVILGGIGVGLLIGIFGGVLREEHLVEVMILLGFSVGILVTEYRAVQEIKQGMLEEREQLLLKERKRENEERNKKIGNIILKSGIVIIFILGIIAIGI